MKTFGSKMTLIAYCFCEHQHCVLSFVFCSPEVGAVCLLCRESRHPGTLSCYARHFPGVPQMEGPLVEGIVGKNCQLFWGVMTVA